MENLFSRPRKSRTERKFMNFKIIIAGLLAIALIGCSNGDPKAYLGYWTKTKYKHMVLEITDEGSNHYLLNQFDSRAVDGFPPRKEMASMKDGQLMIGGKSVPILKNGSLLYYEREWVRMTEAEVEAMKVKLANPQKD